MPSGNAPSPGSCRRSCELGDSEEEARDKANDLMIQLGLVPENMETVYDLAGTEEAKLQLDLLQGYIAAIPADVQTTITQQVLAGDYVGAVATVQAYADAHPATLYVDADVSRALEAIRRVREALAAAQVASIVLGVSSQSATTSTAPTSAAARSVAVAPAAVAGAGQRPRPCRGGRQPLRRRTGRVRRRTQQRSVWPGAASWR